MAPTILPGAEPWSFPGEGTRAKVGIVICHGFTGNPTSMRPLADALGKQGFAIELLRLPGHGTTVQDMLPTRYGDWRAELEHHAAQLGSRGCTVLLCGLSMGGTLALDIAANEPGRIAGVVAINATVLDRGGLLAKLAPTLEKILPMVPAAAAGLIKNDIARGGDEQAYAWVPAAAANSFLVELPRIRKDLAKLTAPVLVANSPQDHSVDPENSLAIARLCGGPVETLSLTRSYHVATMDWDLELLADRISRFADRLTPA